MDWAGWALFGLAATSALTAIMIVAQLAGLTRLDLPLLLGTLVTEDPDRARAAGFFIHLTIGQGFALAYAASFALLDRATWWLGGLLGVLHGGMALTVLPLLAGVHPRVASNRAGLGSTGMLEPPGLLGLNYGIATPLVAAAARGIWHRAWRAARLAVKRRSSPDPVDLDVDRDGAVGPARIEAYALLGDTRTAALTADGSIDWMCVPRFDGAPLFGRLVGGPDGGTFSVGPAETATTTTRRYLGSTVTLRTTWATPTGELTLTEGMVANLDRRLLPSTLLVRRLRATGGPVRVRLLFDPRLGDTHRRPRLRRDGTALVCSWGSLAVALHTSRPLNIEPGEPITVTVDPGRPLTLALAVADREPLVHVDTDVAWQVLDQDQARWQAWSDEIDAELPHRDPVVRSLLTLRLLTYSPSGAPVAAPTTSLPEELGGTRNWDYRFAWPRDASIGIAAFLGAGKTDEARHFLAWLLHASRLDRPRLPVLLTLHGRHPSGERELPGWPGYAHSRPVRAGNAAADQHQLDGYGWVLDAGWLLVDAGHHLYAETWRALRGFADQVSRRWTEPDAGIWEVRGDPAHHVHSKLMAWLALDRALRISTTHRTPARQVRRWAEQRHAIATDVATKGFDPDIGTYTRTYGSTDLDSALLVLPLLGLEPAGSPRIRGTIDAVRDRLSAGGPLLYRYPPGADGLPGSEGAFLPCSFWMVQALAASGRHTEATALLTDLLALANPVGLYPEEMDPNSHRFLGNFPQALTHAALVQAAIATRRRR